MIYTRDSQGNIQQGCTKIKFNRDLKVGNKIYHDGYYHRDGTVIKNVHVSSPKGNLLYGRVLIGQNIEGTFGEVIVLPEDWYQDYIDIYLDTTEAGEGIFQLNHMYASQTILAGDSYATTLTEFRVVIDPTKKYTPLVDASKVKRRKAGPATIDMKSVISKYLINMCYRQLKSHCIYNNKPSLATRVLG